MFFTFFLLFVIFTFSDVLVQFLISNFLDRNYRLEQLDFYPNQKFVLQKYFVYEIKSKHAKTINNFWNNNICKKKIQQLLLELSQQLKYL